MAAEKEVAKILCRPYHWCLIPDYKRGKLNGYTALILEFPGCVTQGDTADEAMTMLREAAELWVDVCLDDGHPIPTPRETLWKRANP